MQYTGIKVQTKNLLNICVQFCNETWRHFRKMCYFCLRAFRYTVLQYRSVAAENWAICSNWN